MVYRGGVVVCRDGVVVSFVWWGWGVVCRGDIGLDDDLK